MGKTNLKNCGGFHGGTNTWEDKDTDKKTEERKESRAHMVNDTETSYKRQSERKIAFPRFIKGMVTSTFTVLDCFKLQETRKNLL